MIRVKLATGEFRTFIRRGELPGLLGSARNSDSYREAVRLLQEAGLLTPHTRDRSNGGGKRGWLLPQGWEPIHAPHLARRLRALRYDRDGSPHAQVRIIPL